MPSIIRRRILTNGRARWDVRFPVKGPDGSIDYLRRSFTKKGDAEDWVGELRVLKRNHRLAGRDRRTVAQFLTAYLADAAHRLRPITVGNYRRVLARHVLPTLGAYRLQDLEPLQIQACYNELTDEGLAPATVRLCHAILRGALGTAVRWNILTVNPADNVTLPKAAARRQIRTLDPTQAAAFLETVREDALGPLWEILIQRGLRPGEGLALTWPDLDLDRGTVTVNRSLTRLPEGWSLTDPKRPASIRTVPLPASTVARLRTHGLEQRLRLGPAWRGDGFVFCEADGEPLQIVNVRQRLRALLRQTGRRLYPGDSAEAERQRSELAKLSLYSLRHSAISLMGAAGLPVKLIAEWAGHADPGLTLRVYSHTHPSQHVEASEALERLLGS